MNLIIGGENSGKTIELLKISAEKGIPIICATKQKCLSLKEKAKKLNLNIPEPMSVAEFIETADFSKINDILIDDLDFVLEVLLSSLNINLVCATISYKSLEF